MIRDQERLSMPNQPEAGGEAIIYYKALSVARNIDALRAPERHRNDLNVARSFLESAGMPVYDPMFDENLTLDQKVVWIGSAVNYIISKTDIKNPLGVRDFVIHVHNQTQNELSSSERVYAETVLPDAVEWLALFGGKRNKVFVSARLVDWLKGRMAF